MCVIFRNYVINICIAVDIQEVICLFCLFFRSVYKKVPFIALMYVGNKNKFILKRDSVSDLRDMSRRIT